MEHQVKGHVLIVDDDPTGLKLLSAILAAEGFLIHQAEDVDHAIALLDRSDLVVDAIITDMKMPDKTGLELFQYVEIHHSEIPVIFLTAYGTIEAAVKAVLDGAYHYFVKPPDYKQLKEVVAAAVEQGRLKREVTLLGLHREDEQKSFPILGDSPAMKRIYDAVHGVKNSSCSVLICGEPGSGKELIARSLHFSSNRSLRPFVPVNCAAISGDLMEAEMFGYEKGAFQGASQRRLGRVESAAGGTLFIDEVGELDLSVQCKLLRLLQEGKFTRLGDPRLIEVDFRLIASTSRNLRQEVDKGSFREDLYYRINIVCIHVPPLRDRKQDIDKLARFFMDQFCAREGKTLVLGNEVLEILQDYSWPGNVRELKNVMEGVVALATRRKISVDDLPVEICAAGRGHNPTQSRDAVKTLKQVEVDAVKHALRSCGGNKSKAAQLLGVSRKTLYKRIKETAQN